MNNNRINNLLLITVVVVMTYSMTYYVHGQSSTTVDFFQMFEEVTKEPPKSYGAIFKCGEGEDKGLRLCVHYDNCDSKTNSIIASENYDGTNLIDIRLGANRCDHPLEVCCDIPNSGIPPGVRLPQVPETNPTSSTTRPNVPNPNPLPNPNPNPNPTPNPNPNPNPVSGDATRCGIRNADGIDFKITGNSHNEAEFGEFPWMVALLLKGENVIAICGGSLITPSVVLTGAHCVAKYEKDPSNLKVRVGEWDTQTTRERLPYQERDVTRVIINEKFGNANLFNDVALLLLSTPVTPAKHIGTVCLPSQNLQYSSTECFATGWGKNVFGRKGQYQVILKKIQLPLVPNDSCENSLRKTRLGMAFKLHSSFICAGGEAGKDTCTGDGGGPLVCPDPNNPGRYQQRGIVAWGIGCGDTGIPGVYVDVAQFRTWIDEQLNRLNIDATPYVD